jgi:cytochrome P450 family 110
MGPGAPCGAVTERSSPGLAPAGVGAERALGFFRLTRRQSSPQDGIVTLPPGSTLPAAVQTLSWMLRPIESFEEAFHRFGDIYTLKNSIFGTEVIISRPEAIKEVFTGDPAIYQAGAAAAALGLVLGDRSVLLLDGEEHLRQRRLMLPSFHGERMQLYAETMRDITEQVMDHWPRGEPFAFHPSMQRIALEVILRTVFGLDEGAHLDELRNRLTAFLDRIQSPFGLLSMLPALQRDLGPFTPWASFLRDRARVDALIHDQIARRRADPSASGRTDVLAMLLTAVDEEGKRMTSAELRDELMTILSAGHETTATALCWSVQEILSRPAVLERLLEELHSVIPGTRLMPEHLPRLAFLDAVIKETLRLRPPIPFVGRKLKVGVTLCGYEIPAGTLVVPCIYLTHRLPEIYPEPAEFRPERFLDKRPDPYTWLPFGGGTHRCLGMAFALYEMKVILATVLLRAKLRLARRAPAQVSLRSFVIAPKGGTQVVWVSGEIP